MPGTSTARRLSKHKTLDGGQVRAISMLEAAARLRIGRNTMQRLISEKKVRSVRIGRMVRIPVEAIDEYLAKLQK